MLRACAKRGKSIRIVKHGFLLLLLLWGTAQVGYGQRVYADAQRNDISSSLASVSNPQNSVNPPYTDFTLLTASTALVGSQAWQQLIFPTDVPANAVVYIKITSTSALLGGAVTVRAYKNSTAGTNGTAVSTESFLFTSIDGMTYMAVTAAEVFNAVRLTLSSPALLGELTLRIYYAFYDSSTTSECAEILGSSVGGSGISLGGGVINELYAIDNDLATFSSLNGLVGLGNTISQSAHFATRSNVGDAATITFSVPPALLQLSLFNNVVINTYAGLDPTPVSSTSLSSLLSLDLLGLLSSGGRYTVSVVPGGQFDRIEVSVATGVSLLSSFRVHEIQRTPAKPVTPIAYPDVIEICDGETVSISAASSSAGSMLRWYDAVNDGVLLRESATNSDTFTTDPLYYTSNTDTVFLYVAASWDSGCFAESERTKIAIIVNPKPEVSPISGVTSICENETTMLSSEIVDGVWVSLDEGIATIDTSGMVTGIAVGTATIQYSVAGPNSLCTTTVETQITIRPRPGKPQLSISDVTN